MKGELIVFEGIDCSFKETNAKCLLDYINRYTPDKKPVLVSFPRYDNPSSYFVKEYLAGKYGGQDNVTSEAISNLYMIDMFDYMRKEGEAILESGRTLILDRYWFSNLYYRLGYLYQQSELDDDFFYGSMSNEIPKEIFKLSIVYDLPMPDIVFKMISCNNAIKSKISEKDTTKDIHEANTDYLMYVKKVFDAFDFKDYFKNNKDIKQCDIVVSNDINDTEYNIRTKINIFDELITRYELNRKR